MAYERNTPPDTYDASWWQIELDRIRDSIGLQDIAQLAKKYAEPDRPRDGMIVYADGTTWDPGSGEGFYGYYGGAWHSLG